MTRGDASNRRRHDVRVRLNDDEWAAWDAARAASGRREMGAWVRAVVSEMLGAAPADRRAGDLPRVTVPETNRAAATELHRVGNNLNQLARSAHVEGRIEDVDELRRVLLQVEDALRLVRGQRPPRVVAPRTNVGDPPPAPAGPVPVDEHQVADTAAAAVLRAGRRWFGAGAAR